MNVSDNCTTFVRRIVNYYFIQGIANKLRSNAFVRVGAGSYTLRGLSFVRQAVTIARLADAGRRMTLALLVGGTGQLHGIMRVLDRAAFEALAEPIFLNYSRTSVAYWQSVKMF
jgi:hypothetical protein